MPEQTFLMIKPDGVKRRLVGDILIKLEKKGLKIVAMKMLQITRELAEIHYQEHRGKGFYEELIKFITSGPVVAMVLEGEGIVEIIRNFAGKTNPKEAGCGTIRGDYAYDLTQNVVHTSDSIVSAKREIINFFEKAEILGK
ncbi:MULTISPECIES: nucleoside-diphosphate kinase [Psychrilyobacter]|uniref:Nucleoside diphosphate kinase n=1 Tax=Psychrilyobacter piezotolerans TaxID=2293438 RepID=A0ABX9KEG7_9FUSO|nr:MULTISPECIES: nucleoside-diphosphate kinase [Psychrilyobacter]MCS5421328.1 nucleoside-diphosphate kinase [Psychrilyobacter sp. S5]NDI78350.1 nucleoside-diphosphate kinase [Psychrilyobacter piezotolerans]RDE59697.1 nucleoside-diphosphate kinase [Psychrilyobacter sp. S5]REI40073.1 nucleoside-diphosphate kinase [Psychrilyobacter piezotolerans]